MSRKNQFVVHLAEEIDLDDVDRLSLILMDVLETEDVMVEKVVFE